nr:multidrug resistance-associated protein 5 [Tanacetum cinerariifolium]
MVVPRMPYEQLVEFLEEKYGCYFQGLYYQVPSQDLEKGLFRVSDDRSTSYMFDVKETFGKLNLYLDHLDMNLSEYLSQAITYDIDDLVSKKTGPHKKRYCNDFSVDEMVDWVEGVEARTRTKDKGKERVSEDASDITETRRCTVEVDTETEYDSDYQSDKLVDYLSPGKDELIKLRNRMKANRKEKAKAKDKPDSRMNEPNEENNMPADNVRSDTFEEHDIYMNELLKSFKTADKDGITKDLFISIEKHTERSEEEGVVAKCGQRPPRVSAPEKGKQRKQTKYPCASSDASPKCPWRCYARWMTAEKTFQCISLVDEHTYVRNFNFGALVNYKWIAKIFGDKIRANPHNRLCDIADLVMKSISVRSYGKHKPFLTMLEDIRVIVLGRINKLREISRKWNPRRGPVRDEGASGTRRCAIGSRGRGGRWGVDGSRGGANGSIGRGAGGFGDASGSKGRGTSGSKGVSSGSRGRGVGGSKRKPVLTAETQKNKNVFSYYAETHMELSLLAGDYGISEGMQLLILFCVLIKVRVSIAADRAVLEDATGRVKSFCSRHAKH